MKTNWLIYPETLSLTGIESECVCVCVCVRDRVRCICYASKVWDVWMEWIIQKERNFQNVQSSAQNRV